MIGRMPWWAVLWTALVSTPASAQSLDAVRVLFHGGQTSVLGLDKVGDEVTELGAYTMASDAVAALDYKVLPGGGALLGQASGAGFAILDDAGAVIELLDPLRRYREVARVAVASYSAFGVPARILVGDSFSSVITIRDLQTDQTVWYRSAFNGTSFGQVAAVAAAPNNEAVVAMRWDDLGLSVIDRYELGVNGDPFQIASVDLGTLPPDGVVQEAIDGIRDVFVRADGTLAVATDFDVLVLSATGEVLARLPLALSGVGGVPASVKSTPNGWVVFAMYEPGKWTQPSELHRVWWWHPPTDALVGSGSLSAAPAAIDLFAGHGGTGTESFLAGLDELANGQLSDIEALAVSPASDRFSNGDVLSVRVAITNRGSFPVPVSRHVIEAGPGACEDVTTFPETLGQRDAVIVYPAANLDLTSTRVVDARMPPGVWCVRSVVLDASARERELSPRVAVTILDAAIQGEPLDSTVLDFHDAPDAGADADTMDEPQPSPVDDGCGCGGVDITSASGWFLAMVFGRRRRAKRAK